MKVLCSRDQGGLNCVPGPLLGEGMVNVEGNIDTLQTDARLAFCFQFEWLGRTHN